MGLKSLRIELTDEQDGITSTFTAGQKLRGRLILNFDHPTDVNSIFLRFHGAAKVYWTLVEGEDSISYSDHETYFDCTALMWRSDINIPRHPAGDGVYAFEYQLPPNIPSSFEGGTGWVRYSIECIINRPLRFDHKKKIPFTVHSVLDLNKYPDTRTQVQASNSKQLCCWCCTTGPITITMHLDRCGYVSGEYVAVNAEIDNKSDKVMKASSLRLTQEITFKSSDGDTCRESNVVCSVKRGAIQPGHSDIWNGQLIQVPSLPPSGLIYCNLSIIDIKYYLVLITYPSGPSSNLETSCELTIGTIPLRNL